MNPYSFPYPWGYPRTLEWCFPEPKWDYQEGDEYGSRVDYQLPFVDEKPYPPDVQEFSPYYEGYHLQEEAKSQLELLVEKFVLDNEKSYSEPAFPTMDPPHSDVLYEAEEICNRTEKLNSMVKEACARFTQDQLLAVREEKEDEEESLKDELEQLEVFTDGHRDAQDLESPLEIATTLPHFIPSVKEEDLHEEMRVEPIDDIAWRLAIQRLLAEEQGKIRKEEAVEEVESNEEEFLEDPKEEEYEEEKELDETIGLCAKEEVLVEEACISHVINNKSPPNIEELLSKDPFAITLCPTKAHLHHSSLIEPVKES
ncbi:unnamed protein product [Linum trigynum]|uniref:Uncharacterized protein n=1 Tax=Linum trigynum TaxID=586398 RepID=A0AAV2CTJ4_9ROSI